MAGLGATPMTKVELRISCKNLVDKDIGSKSDPIVAMYTHDKGHWLEYGRTEWIQNNLNPEFTKTIEIDYLFEEVQNLRFRVFDIDNKSATLDDDDFLGELECTLGLVVSNSPFTKPLLKKGGKPSGKGTITICAEEMPGSKEVLVMNFKATNLDKKDTFSKSDPYLEFLRQAPNGNWQVVHRTEVINNNLNPVWKPATVPSYKLTGGNAESPIKVDCYDYDDDGSHDLIGVFMTSLPELTQAVDKEVSWECINPKKKAKKKSYKNSGVVYLSKCVVTYEYSFLDFVFGGCQINFTVGVDFTASNGDPKSANSLHYMNPYEPNEYLSAISAVGNVIQDYDSDKLFPALGFGARIPPDNRISHEFPLNFNAANPYCQGIEGIIGAYKNCIPQIQLYGPTNFSPLIYHAAQFAAAAANQDGASNYFVLLILTDGVITDMDNTRQAIVYASQLPMSIIIVGVGQADFSDMIMLDGDDGVLKDASGRPATRDIVQFVPFRDFKKVGSEASAAALAKHVLAEVPNQVTGYYRMRGISPNVKKNNAPAQ